LTSIRNRLLADRKSLLDLGTRNRLINIPLRTKNIRAIEVVDAKTSEVFRMLGEGKRFTFLATAPEESMPLIRRRFLSLRKPKRRFFGSVRMFGLLHNVRCAKAKSWTGEIHLCGHRRAVDPPSTGPNSPCD
jgi:hypothetical protein